MTESPFAADFRALLEKHGIKHPRFAHSAKLFDPAKPQVLYSGPVFDQEELVAATAALCEGKWSVSGEYVHRFEQEFSKYLNQKESVMVNSGSSADLLLIAACKERYGWKTGDGVLVSPVGFPTSISALTLNGLVPVFVDIEWETLNADNNAIERVLIAHNGLDREGLYIGPYKSPRIRAIFLSPVLGNPPNIDRLVSLSDQYRVKLILDGCDSLGSTWRGKHLVEYATATTCSFFPSHHASTLQGGMISSNDTELIRIARQMSTWGRSCFCVAAANLLPKGTCGCRFKEWLPETCPGVILDHKYIYETSTAYNLAPLDIQGAMGLEQMKKMEMIHEGRRKAWSRINSIFECHLPSLRLLEMGGIKQHEQAVPSWFGYPVICSDYSYKQALVSHLEAAGIQTRNYFAGNILLHKGYSHLGRAEDYPNANEVLKRVFFIGCHPQLTEEHFIHIESTIKSFIPPTKS